MTDEPAPLRIKVVYALPTRQPIVELLLPAGATVLTAVERSGLRERFDELQQRPLNCAIYGRAVPLSTALCDGDRVEILRPLLIDPKESRRRAAQVDRTGARRK